jgi:MFS family permease
VLNSASVFGIIKDLGLSTKLPSGATSTLRYSTAQAAFYFGYILAVLPFAFVLQRLPLARTLGIAVFLWGVVTILTVVVKDFKGLVVQRVFLGIVEVRLDSVSATLESTSAEPAVILSAVECLPRLPTCDEHVLFFQRADRPAWHLVLGHGHLLYVRPFPPVPLLRPPWLTFVPLALTDSFSGAVNYGLGSAGGSLAPWKTMYLFAGAITMAWGVVVFLLLPESPARPGRFFSADDRRVLLDRTRRNQTGLNRKSFQLWQVREALQDPAIYFYLLLGSAIYVGDLLLAAAHPSATVSAR